MSELPPNEPVTGSTDSYLSGSIFKTFELASPSDYAIKGEERVISVLARQVDHLTKELYEIKKEKLLDETQLPSELLEQLGVTSTPPRRFKNGRGYRPLLSHEILEAKRILVEKKGFFTEAMVARYLDISFPTYKKYAKMYNIWDPKPLLRGKRGYFDPDRGKYPLNEILEGKHPNYPVFRIKDKLIRSGIKKPQCELCGFNEKRFTDGKVPLILNFLDGNPKNHKLENMKLYCYNHTFTSGKGYIRRGNHFFDPDFLQDGNIDDARKPARF